MPDPKFGRRAAAVRRVVGALERMDADALRARRAPDMQFSQQEADSIASPEARAFRGVEKLPVVDATDLPPDDTGVTEGPEAGARLETRRVPLAGGGSAMYRADPTPPAAAKPEFDIKVGPATVELDEAEYARLLQEAAARGGR